MKNLLKYLCFVSLLSLFACDGDDNNNPSANSRMQIRLTDGPGDYQKVIIDVREIMITSDEDDENWTTLPNVRTGSYDLLRLTAGLDTLLVDATVAPGKISKIRLVLGDGNFVQVDDELIQLETPSAQQSGLKINLDRDLAPGLAYNVLLDFDVAKSIVQTGNGKYILKPVIRAIVNDLGGSIAGKVDASPYPTQVLAILGADTVGSYTDTTGAFLIQGLTPGTYSVIFNPAELSLLQGKTVQGVLVLSGQTTNMGDIDL